MEFRSSKHFLSRGKNDMVHGLLEVVRFYKRHDLCLNEDSTMLFVCTQRGGNNRLFYALWHAKLFQYWCFQ